MDTAQGDMTKALLIVMSILFLLTLFVILFFIIYQRRLQQQQTKQRQMETDYQLSLLKATINSQEKERNRIAKELHDDIGAMLTTTQLYTKQISPDLPSNELTQITKTVATLFNQMVQSTRRISQDLRPVILEKLGLIEAILSLVKTVNATGQLKVEFSENTTTTVTKPDALNLYRILQELITNTIRHADASIIRIRLLEENKMLTFIYEDNGKGIEQNSSEIKKGIGLKNIESRVSVLSGSIIYNAVPIGISIKIIIPLK